MFILVKISALGMSVELNKTHRDIYELISLHVVSPFRNCNILDSVPVMLNHSILTILKKNTGCCTDRKIIHGVLKHY